MAAKESLRITFPTDFPGSATAAVISAVTDVLTSYEVSFGKPGDNIDSKKPGKRYFVAGKKS